MTCKFKYGDRREKGRNERQSVFKNTVPVETFFSIIQGYVLHYIYIKKTTLSYIIAGMCVKIF